MFDKILVANRGEIAVRVFRTCRRLGVATVAVYSEADLRSPYVREADEAVLLGPPPARDSYLDGAKIIAAALATGAQAVHPGYGFLSENAEFARRVAEQGLVFIGPTPEAIATLGDKMASKALALRAGMPVVPGHNEPLADLAEAEEVVRRIGLPVLLKPAAGGGGRGMRIVERMADLPGALAACREETRKAFADDRIFVERYIARPRHIEFQLMGDRFGNVIHLGERECSIQRRYQKVLEETPSPALDAALREKMGAVACALAREAGYTNAGTVEFILDQDHNFFFLEMNTRLQVEHPITELVTSLDLVELQLRVAAGEALPVKQEHVRLTGWAMEARICAEDPERGFFPTTGMVTRYVPPRGEHVRLDSAIDAGSVVTIYYDSLLAKLVVWGQDRPAAQRALSRALNGYSIEGLITNLDFVNSIVNHPDFIRGDLSTDFIEKHFAGGKSKDPPAAEHLRVMAMAAALVYHNRDALVRESLKPMSPHVGATPRSTKSYDYVVRAGDDVFEVTLEGGSTGREWTVRVDGMSYEVVTPEFEYYRRQLKLTIDGAPHLLRMDYRESHLWTAYCGVTRTVEVYTPREWAVAHYMLRERAAVAENVLRCPMPGLITQVCVAEGDQVQHGQELVRMESMKMETGIASPCDGQIDKILVQAGSTVETDDLLVTFRV